MSLLQFITIGGGALKNYQEYHKAVSYTHLDVYKRQELTEIRSNSRENNSEGLMLKQKNSNYHSGRKKGDWWKWKVDALTIDAVLIYAQKGSGRRSGYYTDYTFAVKKEDKLVTIAKAYSCLLYTSRCV